MTSTPSTPEDLAADLKACVSEVSYERMIRRIDRFPQVVRELIEARAEIERLLAMLKRWVSEPWDTSGWDNPHCLEEQRQELEDACEIYGVELPEWWTAERKDGAE